ncbi:MULTISPECIES: tripartite tricarboxylate transporter substrate binding protein [unclassified Vibrio]|uniref:Bug family tripartite tricarboxylate transporter substrate binding protein n=1 Tax=Vibrio sp. HB236076 TaxID=3232307 RepID=A0AB39HDI1_9VIBR|nr:tripartite tricarboxylate transporter substrate binding protein [Vibrio sp. HB161653]MDP5255137.1 tripartite tricarboxylate transporter substrate binding protein [Vibrio sp. HB161653]
MNRRRFIINSSLFTLSGLSPIPLLAKDDYIGQSNIYFGFNKEGIAGILGRNIINKFNSMYPNHVFNYINETSYRGLKAPTIVKNTQPGINNLIQVTSAMMSVYPTLYKTLPFDPINDFTPIGTFGDFTFALVVGPNVPDDVLSVDDYVQWIRDNPSYRDIGAALYGSESHLACLILSREKKVALRSVYYGGMRLIVEDLLDGELAAAFLVPGIAKPFIESGQFRMLAVTSAQRSRLLPDIPTLQENGVEGVDLNGWIGLMAPANISQDMLDFYISTLDQIKSDDEFKRMVEEKYLMEVNSISPLEVSIRLNSDKDAYAVLFDKYQISKIS